MTFFEVYHTGKNLPKRNNSGKPGPSAFEADNLKGWEVLLKFSLGLRFRVILAMESLLSPAQFSPDLFDSVLALM